MSAFVHVLVVFGISALFALVMVEAIAGCGATTYHHDGTYTTGECVFLTHKSVSGRWR